MRLPTSFEGLVTDGGRSLVYGEPYTAADGTTVITVARVKTRDRDGALETRARPFGVYVIKDGDAKWRPAVDVNRNAFLGILAGLIPAALATLAMVRRPPWPDLTLPGWSPAEYQQRRRELR